MNLTSPLTSLMNRPVTFSGPALSATPQTGASPLQNGPSSDVFFGGKLLSPAEQYAQADAEGTDKVALKNGAQRSLAVVLELFDTVKMAAGNPHFTHHLFETANDGEDGFCEGTFEPAVTHGLIDNKGNMPDVVKDVVNSSMKVEPLETGELSIQVEDPMEFTLGQRIDLANEVGGTIGILRQFMKEVLGKGDEGVGRLRQMRMMGLTGDTLADAVIGYCDGDADTLLQRMDEGDAVLNAMAAKQD